MTAEQHLELSWDEPAAMWRLDGGAAGAAGASVLELGSVLWRFDRLEPGRIVEAYVPTEGDDRRSAVPPVVLAAVRAMCGDRTVAAITVQGAEPGDRPRSIVGDADTASRRLLAARLALALDAVDASPAPTWWTVEAAWAAAELGATDADELTGASLDVLDGLPGAFLSAVASRQLATPIRAVLSRLGVADHELPEPLRLADAEAHRRFEELVELFGDRPAVLGPQLGVPTFRRDGDRGRESGEVRPVEWIDVPGEALRRAVWTSDGGGRADVVVTATGATPGLRARLVDVSGRVPIVLDVAQLVPTGTRGGVTTLVATLRGSTASGSTADGVEEHRVELVVDEDAEPLDAIWRGRRHATNLARAAASLERAADAAARFHPTAAPEATRRAADRWATAAAAWQAHDLDHAAVCTRRADQLDDRITRAESTAGEGVGEVAGWAEAVSAIAAAHLAEESAVTAEPRPAHEAAGLAVLAESLDDVEAAARFRVEQTRSMVDGVARGVTARVALSHFAVLGTAAPLDIGGFGARDG